jgi:hypothetical protein
VGASGAQGATGIQGATGVIGPQGATGVGQANNVVLEVSLTANQTGITANSWATVKYNNVVTDTQTAYSTSTGVFTPKAAGLYAVSASIATNNVQGNWTAMSICKNGSLTTAENMANGSLPYVSSVVGVQSITGLIYCNGTTDTIEIKGYMPTGSTVFFASGNATMATNTGVVNMVVTLLQSGPPGATGIQGPQGATGLVGATGLIGASGATGAQGATGLTSVSGLGSPTTQKFVASGAFTYTSTSNAVKWIRIRACASGGGGSATSGASNGTAASDLTFSVGGVLAVTLGGGKGGVSIGGGAGGVYTAGTVPANWFVIFALPGGTGSCGATYGSYGMGGAGGVNGFGGVGGGGGQSVGFAGASGCGAGGGGGGYGGNAVAAQGAGGGAGAWAEIIVVNPTPGSTFSFTGVLGAAGVGGFASGQYAGAAGGIGGVYIEEFYV